MSPGHYIRHLELAVMYINAVSLLRHVPPGVTPFIQFGCTISQVTEIRDHCIPHGFGRSMMHEGQ